MVTENLTQAQIERYVSEFMLELGVPAHLRDIIICGRPLFSLLWIWNW